MGVGDEQATQRLAQFHPAQTAMACTWNQKGAVEVSIEAGINLSIQRHV
jgi:hypothetical protein